MTAAEHEAVSLFKEVLAVKRENWIDACRFFAIFVIMATHFLATFRPEALALWERMPSRLLLGGLTGKMAVAFFFVVLGYFASAPRSFDARSFAAYALRRYGQFAFFVFAVTLCYIVGCYGVTWLFHLAEGEVLRAISDGPRYNLIYLLRDAFLFENNYNDTLWCMRQLFIASLLCRLLGYLPERLNTAARFLIAAAVILCAVLLGSRWVWLGTAALGYVLRLLLERAKDRPRLRSPAALWLLFLAAVALIKAPVSEETRPLLLYSLQSVGTFLLLFVLFHADFAQRLLAARPFPWLGRISMGLFVAHTPINELLGSSVWALLRTRIPEAPGLALCFALSLGLSVLAAWLLHRVYGWLVKRRRPA